MRTFRVEILDPLQNHRIIPGPYDELPFQPVAVREMPAARLLGIKERQQAEEQGIELTRRPKS
jgi:hypothetical protein